MSAAANSGSASAAFLVFSSSERAAREESTEVSVDDEGVIEGDEVEADSTNFSGDGETGSCLIVTGVTGAGVAAGEGVEIDRGGDGDEEGVGMPVARTAGLRVVRAATEALAARRFFASAFCCLALARTLWSTVN